MLDHKLGEVVQSCSHLLQLCGRQCVNAIQTERLQEWKAQQTRLQHRRLRLQPEVMRLGVQNLGRYFATLPTTQGTRGINQVGSIQTT